MPPMISPEDAVVMNAITELGRRLWAKSEAVVGRTSEPRIVSVMLFRRLWSNHRGFITLWNAGLQTEADIVLRSAVEATICLAALQADGEGFVVLAGRDAAATLRGQAKLFRDDGDEDMARHAEARADEVMAKLPKGQKATTFRWRDLARLGGFPHLYAFHKGLSGLSSHVTGASIIRGVIGVDGDGSELQAQLARETRTSHFMMMAGVTLLGCTLHAGCIEAGDLAVEAASLAGQLDRVSAVWDEASQSEQAVG